MPQHMRRQDLVDAAVFLREFVRSPLLTASVAPSSRVLADHIAAPVPAQGTRSLWNSDLGRVRSPRPSSTASVAGAGTWPSSSARDWPP